MNFATIKGFTIPEGVVVKAELNNVVLWQKEKVVVEDPNKVPTSIDTDGSIFNGIGYKNGNRLSSSGVVKTASNATVTGFIKASSGDTVYIGGEGVNWLFSGGQSTNYVCTYDNSFNFISVQNCTSGYSGGTVGGDTKVATVKLPTNSKIAYVRVSSVDHSNTAVPPSDKLVVTVNEPIE